MNDLRFHVYTDPSGWDGSDDFDSAFKATEFLKDFCDQLGLDWRATDTDNTDPLITVDVSEVGGDDDFDSYHMLPLRYVIHSISVDYLC